MQEGEGIASIARSFSYAGAKSLIATQWSVDDKATNELVHLMGGQIWLDESYRSGYGELRPGARIVVNLNRPPESITAEPPLRLEDKVDVQDEEAGLVKLPEKLSVLFVDDSLVLRKQCSRAIHRMMPEWVVREAASGEACLTLCEKEAEPFDLIFLE